MTFYSFSQVSNVINLAGHAYYIFHDFRFMNNVLSMQYYTIKLSVSKHGYGQ